MFNKKFAAFAVCGALLVGTVGGTSVFAANQSDQKADYEEQIEALETRYDDLYEENESLWDKVDAAVEDYFNGLEDSEEEFYDYECEFDEASFIQSLDILTDTEKTTLLQALDEMDEINSQLEELYEQSMLADMTEEQQEAYQKLNKLYDQENAIYDRHAQLWDKVMEAEDAEYEECDEYEEFDMIAYIQESEALTEDEKETLISAEESLDAVYEEIEQLYEQYDAGNIDDDAVDAQLTTLWDREEAIYNEHEELWDKLYNVEGYEEETFDEASFIQNMDNLTEDEKAVLIADLEEIEILEEQMISLEELVYGDLYEE